MDDKAFAARALEQNLVTISQLAECQKIQADLKDKGLELSLAEILVKKGYVTAAAIEQIKSTLSVPTRRAVPSKKRPDPLTMGGIWKRLPIERRIVPPRSIGKSAGAKVQQEAQSSPRLRMKLWLGVGIGLGAAIALTAIAIFLGSLSAPVNSSREATGRTRSFDTSTFRAEIRTLVFANEFSRAAALVHDARSKLSEKDATELSAEIDREATAAVASLLPKSEDDLSLSELPNILKRLNAFKHRVSGVPAAAAKLDEATRRLGDIEEAFRAKDSLDRELSQLLYAQRYDEALALCRKQAVQTRNPVFIEKIQNRMKEIESIRTAAASIASPAEIESLVKMVRASLDSGDRARAGWILRGALEKAPRSADLLGLSAWCRMLENENDVARRLAQEALQIDPTQGEANYVRGALSRNCPFPPVKSLPD
jgi:hypothetical protein